MKLAVIAGKSVRSVAANQDLIQEGDRPTTIKLILGGVACRYKILASGRRQIFAYLLPGDFCDLHVVLLGRMDHGIRTMSQCIVSEVPSEIFHKLTLSEGRLARALWWATLVDEAILREWLVSMGQRLAKERTAHFLCEYLLRNRVAGVASGNTMTLPLTQEDLGDTLGLSSVHVNRILQELRADGFIRHLDKATVEVPDTAALSELGQFDPSYLHLRDSSLWP